MAHTKIRNSKVAGRLRRKAHIRKQITGTAERPRLSVFRSAKHIYVQAIDDTANRVLASSSDADKGLRGDLDGKKKSEKAQAVGEAIAKKLVSQDIKTVVFDRNGFMYHGRVKAVADGARSGGLTF